MTDEDEVRPRDRPRPHVRGRARIQTDRTGGVIREITPDKQTVFYVKFDVATGSDFFNKMVNHNVFVDDLYALNGAPK